MSTIRLTKTKKLQKILNELRKKRFQLLDDTEILKAVLSLYYTQLKHSHSTDFFTKSTDYPFDEELKTNEKDSGSKLSP